ncbi:MAG TPA: DUF3788 family protein [Patescibacteria group bacterium]|nr:DUF3788 family protein [Patescibacteria group bacterium]
MTTFRDRDHSPSDHELRAALGEAAARWANLARTLTDELGAKPAWRWDGPRSGWCLPFRRAGRPFVTLTPRTGGFDALVVLGAAEAAVAGALPMGEATREAFADSPQLHDGRWLFLPIASDADEGDLLRLLTVKLPARVRARLASKLHPVPA